VHIELIIGHSDSEGAVLQPEPEHAGGAGTPVDPQHEGGSVRETNVLEKPIEQMVLVLSSLDRESTRIHAREQIGLVPEGETGH